jgi:hypothetical protein
MREKALNDSDAPRWNKSNTARDDASLALRRNDKELPRWKKSITAIDEPTRVQPHIASEAPKRA